ncbi:MAG: hypothetical protein ABJ092_13140 [Gillisia sp.]
MKNFFRIFLSIFISCFFISCAMKPIPSEHNLVMMNKEKITINELGKGTILIYNDANILHTADNTSQLNIQLDGKNLGQLRAKDFAIVKLENGEHVFNIRHLDLVNMRSEHKITVNDSLKVILVKPTITSNKLEIVNQLPANWDKYRYMEPNR